MGSLLVRVRRFELPAAAARAPRNIIMQEAGSSDKQNRKKQPPPKVMTVLANDPNNHTMGSEFTPYYLILMSQGVAFNLKNFYSMIDRHSFVIVSRKKQSHKIIIPGIRLKEGRKR